MFLAKLAPLQKRPPPGQPWQISEDPAVHEDWRREGFGTGLMMRENVLIAIDVDRKDVARATYKLLRKEDKNFVACVTETRRGAHFLFTGEAEKSWKLPSIDVKSSGYIVYPNSRVVSAGEAWQYKFIHDRWEDIQPFPQELFPKPPEVQSKIESKDDRLQLIQRAMRYADRMDPAISGQKGHNTFFRFCCKMVRQPPNGFGLTISECWPIAVAYNARAVPPFSTSEVERKLFQALEKG